MSALFWSILNLLFSFSRFLFRFIPKFSAVKLIRCLFRIVGRSCAAGCIGSAILTAAATSQDPIPRCRLLNLGEGLVPHGTVAQLRHDTGLDAESIAAKAVELVGRVSVKE